MDAFALETIPDGIEFDRDNYLDYRLTMLARDLINEYGEDEAKVIWFAAFNATADEMDTRQ